MVTRTTAEETMAVIPVVIVDEIQGGTVAAIRVGGTTDAGADQGHGLGHVIDGGGGIGAEAVTVDAASAALQGSGGAEGMLWPIQRRPRNYNSSWCNSSNSRT